MKYDAFISYRHGGVDQFVAETLHKKLEAFKLPKRLKEKSNGKERITRVFRDQDELPLSSNLEDSIKDALKESEWLIVICTPRLKDSIWCLKEIETFTEMHGSDHILAVLVEGEPYESFPESLRVHEVKKFDAATGQEIVLQEKVEPLAADVRASSNSKIKKLMDVEILRLLAPMFGVDFDDLKQRQRARKIRRITTLAAIVLTVSVGFGLYASIMYFNLNLAYSELSDKNAEIKAQASKIEAQNDELSEKSDKIEAQMNELLYAAAKNKADESLQYSSNNMNKLAIQVAYDALTDDSEYPLPRTSYGILALSEAMNVYHYDYTLRIVDTVELNKQIVDVSTNGTINYMLLETSDSSFYLYDYINREIIFEKETIHPTDIVEHQRCRFITDKLFVLIDGTNAIFYEVDGSTVNEVKKVSLGFEALELEYRRGSTTVSFTSYSAQAIIDVNTKEVVANNKNNVGAITKDGTKYATIVNGNLTIFEVGNDEPLMIVEPEVLYNSSDVNDLNIISDIDNPNIVYVDLCVYTGTLEYKTVTFAINLEEEGSVIWKKDINTYKPDLEVVKVNDKPGLVLYSKFAMYLLNIENGEFIDFYTPNTSSEYVVDVVPFDTTFLTINASGHMIYYFDGLGFTETESTIDTKGISIKSCEHASSDYGTCYPIILESTTSVSIFAYNAPHALTAVDSFKTGTQSCISYTGVDAKDEAEAKGIPDASLINNYVYIKDLHIAVVNNYTYMRVYDTETSELLYETTYIRDSEVFKDFYAVDEDDNLYIFTNVGAYVFNSDRELIANAIGALDFDGATGKIVYASVYGKYEGGIYTDEELIDLARIKLGL